MAKYYIDREALVEWLKRIPLKDLSDGLGLCRVIMEDDFKKAIKEMPNGIIIDVSPVRHGRWCVDGVYVACSVCNSFTVSPIVERLPTFKYCPFCGAKMDEEEEDTQMSERQEKKRRYNQRLEYIADFNKWLDAEPSILRPIAWHRWKKSRPILKEDK